MLLRLAPERSRSRGLAYSGAVTLATLLAASVLSGCRPHSSGAFKIACRVLPEPHRVGPADVQISVFDSHGKAVPTARVSIEADMSHPGMKPVFASASARDNGRYDAKLDLDMPGDWVLSIRAEFKNGLSANEQVRITVREK
jgi:YtkA-like